MYPLHLMSINHFAAWENPPNTAYRHNNGTCVWLDIDKYKTATNCEDIKINWMTNCNGLVNVNGVTKVRADAAKKHHLCEMPCAKETEPFSK